MIVWSNRKKKKFHYKNYPWWMVILRWIVGPIFAEFTNPNLVVSKGAIPPARVGKSSLFSAVAPSSPSLSNVVKVGSSTAAMEGRGKSKNSGSSSPISLHQFISVMTPLIDMEKVSNFYVFLYSHPLSNGILFLVRCF